MTHDDRISSYIDNEFSAEQEQEFLISLAASEGLRKSFRSELVLKNVLHRDEAAVTPPRKLRAAVFASIGLAGAGLSASNAHAEQASSSAMSAAGSRGLLKVFFATKINTLVTVAGISISALAGYGAHSIVAPAAQVQTVAIEPASHTAPMQTMPSQTMPTQNLNQQVASEPTAPATQEVKRSATQHPVHNAHASAARTTEPVTGTTGGGAVKLNPPVFNPEH